MADPPRNPAVVATQQGVEAAVRLLVGKPLRFAGRAASMLWLHFGDVRTVPTHRGGTKEVGEYALHTEAPWRIVGPEGLVTGNRDLCFGREEPPEHNNELWKKVGTARCDKRLEGLRPLLEAGVVVVESARVDRAGSLRLDLTGGYRFEIMPTDSTDDEQWRMFRPALDEHHLVVTSRGIEPPDDPRV